MKPAARLSLLVAILALGGWLGSKAGAAEPVTADGMQAELSKITSVRIVIAEDGLPTKFVLRFAFSRTLVTSDGPDGTMETEKKTVVNAEVDLALHGGDRSFGATIVKPDGKKVEVFMTDTILAQLLVARANQEYTLRNPKAAAVDALAITPPIINRTKREPLTSKSAPVAANK